MSLTRALTIARAVTSSRTAGMDERTAAARPLVFGLMLLATALYLFARYRLELGRAPGWQGVHIAIALSLNLAIAVGFHGTSLLRSIRARTVALWAVGLALLLLLWQEGRTDAYFRRFGPLPRGASGLRALGPFAYFAANGLLARLVAPLVFARLAFGLRPGALGIPLRRTAERGVPRMGFVYAALYVVMLGPILTAARAPAFLAKYPLARDIVDPQGIISAGALLGYELLYLSVFVAGEAFWRGYLVFSAERDLGLYSVSLMVVPYAMSHVGKPLPEALGSVVAGSVLGVLALRHRSVWLGVGLHYALALTMDVLAIANRGLVIQLR